MNPVIEPKTDIISPNEAKFWQEQAERAPELIRSKLGGMANEMASFITHCRYGLVALGAVLGGASFTKYVPGKWKYASGAGAVASLATGIFAGGITIQAGREASQLFHHYANTLEQSPALREQLAQHLSAHVSAQDIQNGGLDGAVASHAGEFCKSTPSIRMAATAAIDRSR